MEWYREKLHQIAEMVRAVVYLAVVTGSIPGAVELILSRMINSISLRFPAELETKYSCSQKN